MPEQLTAADFEMRYDADHTFPFVESEDAVIMAYGHPDRAELARRVTEYDRIATGEADFEETTADSVQRVHAVLVEGKPGDEWYIRWGKVSADDPGAFPVSVVVR